MYKNQKHLYLLGYIICLLNTNCKIYHNTTGRFNSYFLAKEKIKEIEKNLFLNHTDDFNDILPVLIHIDTNKSKAEKSNLDYAIEKASLSIELHGSSKWADNAWLVVGKSRLYQGDYVNAIHTSKYINSISTEANARHESLVLLLRTFWEIQQYENMQLIKEHIKKNIQTSFNSQNTRNYHLIFSAYHQEKENYALAVQHLELAIPHVKKRKVKARLFYIMGEMYNLIQKPQEAYRSYRKAFRYAPNYELEFNAGLKSFGLTYVDDQKDIVKIKRYYQRLLKDEKNWDYHDKIYYEYALFFLRIKKIEEAKSYLNLSIQESINNEIQKIYSYLKLGELYYEEKNFEQAAAYYDSAVQIIPNNFKNYKKITEKAGKLREFANIYKKIKDEERVLFLTTLTSEELDVYIDKEIEEEKEQIIKQKEKEALDEHKRKKIAQRQNAQSEFEKEGDGVWYFYNPSALLAGRSVFLRKWGSRKLEDNWRRYSKTIVSFEEDITQEEVSEENESQEDIFSSIKSKEERIGEIPNNPEEINIIKDSLAAHVFTLGKIYYYKFNEYPNSVSTFIRVIDSFPQTPFVPEALYILYNICHSYQDCEANKYENILIENYPESFYAKILINPNYVEEINITNNEVSRLYAKCFQLYKTQRYQEAQNIIDKILNEYSENSLSDKVALLSIMIEGHLSEDKTTYKAALNDFIKIFNESDLIPLAKNLLNGFN